MDCRECGRQVSTKAKACPNCGAKPEPKPKPKKKGGLLKSPLFYAVALFGIVILNGIFIDSSKTPEERAADEEKAAAAKIVREKRAAINTEKQAEAKLILDKEAAIYAEEQAAAKIIRDKEKAEKAAASKAQRVKKRAEKQAAKEAEDAENRRKGFHCLSSWNGTHRGVVSKIKTVLNDPDSFEHDETRVAPVENGEHRFTMSYRAKNAFGGIVRGTAQGTYRHDDCEKINITQAQ